MFSVYYIGGLYGRSFKNECVEKGGQEKNNELHKHLGQTPMVVFRETIK